MEIRKNHSKKSLYRTTLIGVLICLLGGLSGCTTVKNVGTMITDNPLSASSPIRFNIPVSKDRTEHDPRTEIVFYTQSGRGVSKENAILTMEGFEDGFDA